MEPITGTLRQRAAETLARHRAKLDEQDAADHLRRTVILSGKLQQVLEVNDDIEVERDGSRPIATVEGLRFTLNYDDQLCLLVRCEYCDREQEAWVESLLSLGQLLKRSLPPSHYCSAGPKFRPQTTEERVISALIDLIAENQGEK